jgi:hypothetical protein
MEMKCADLMNVFFTNAEYQILFATTVLNIIQL